LGTHGKMMVETFLPHKYWFMLPLEPE